MRYVSPDGTGTDLGIIDLSRDMFAVLRDLNAAGASPDIDMVRKLRQHFHVRFDVYTHRARLDAARLALPHPHAVHLKRCNNDDASIRSLHVFLAESQKLSRDDAVAWCLDEIIAVERATRKRVRVRAGPTGRPNIGSKRARQAARAKRAA